MYYLDTCIWLNLFKKEGDSSKGTPYWKIAKEFITTHFEQITISGFVLKELQHKMEPVQYNFIRNYLSYFRFISAKQEDYQFARQLEVASSYSISFFDCLHIALCKRTNQVLVTRDRLLCSFAKNYIRCARPEHIDS